MNRLHECMFMSFCVFECTTHTLQNVMQSNELPVVYVVDITCTTYAFITLI